MKNESYENDDSSGDEDIENEVKINALKKNLIIEENKVKELNEKILKYTNKVQELQNKLADSKKNNKFEQISNNQPDSNPTLITLQENILKLFEQIQSQCNATLQEKYKKESIEQLINQERKLKISFLMIKKLEISEEFYKKHSIEESQNLYDNLQSLNKLNLLNYQNLRNCGSYLVFRLTETTKFSDLKEKSCQIWKIKSTSYSLYDDAFSNMECVLNSDIQKYFGIYEPSDITLPPGQVCFYLVEKLKNQKSLLNVQEKVLTKENSDNNEMQGANFEGAEIEKLITDIKEGKILKGINRYVKKDYKCKKEFESSLKLAENHWIIIFIAILFILLSFLSFPFKMRNISYWSHITKKNLIFLQQISQDSAFSNYNADFSQCINYLLTINNNFKDTNNTFLIPFSYAQFRLFPTQSAKCFDDAFSKGEIAANYLLMSDVTCYEKEFNDDTKDYSYFSDYINNSNMEYAYNIKHKYNTPISKFNKEGLVIKYNPYDSNSIDNVNTIINNTNIQSKIQAIEFSFALFDPSTNLFISNTILAQKELSKGFISDYYSVPFDSNVYEDRKGFFVIDLIRLILIIIMLFTIIINIILKINNFSKITSLYQKILISVNTIFTLKSIALIVSTAFYIRSFVIYSKRKIDTQDHQDNVFNGSEEYKDFYQFAMDQKYARYYEIIAVFIISLYSLKYFQFMDIINIILKSFKQSLYEYTMISLIIGFILIALSLSTTALFGTTLKEFSTFRDSFIVNIQIILFLEKTNILQRTENMHKPYITVLLLFLIFAVRLFFISLFYPIFIEYLRVDLERLERTNDSSRIPYQIKCPKFWSIFKNEEKEDATKKVETVDNFKLDELLERE